MAWRPFGVRLHAVEARHIRWALYYSSRQPGEIKSTSANTPSSRQARTAPRASSSSQIIVHRVLSPRRHGSIENFSPIMAHSLPRAWLGWASWRRCHSTLLRRAVALPCPFAGRLLGFSP
jgi:hypothetical protein